jgi:hypothetical protein
VENKITQVFTEGMIAFFKVRIFLKGGFVAEIRTNKSETFNELKLNVK